MPYSVHLRDLVKKFVKKFAQKNNSDTDTDTDTDNSYDYAIEEEITKYISDMSYEKIRKLIVKELLTWKDSVERQYLLQCADWDPSEYNKNVWIAYSPIYNRYSGGVWPIYDISLEYSDKMDITFHSWKGDYEPTVSYQYGSLSYGGDRKFKGTIWTRGE